MADKDDKHQIHFNKPPDEVLRERRARRELTEEQRINQERMAGLKAPRPPLGGAPPVSIPPLDAEPIENFPGSISDQAAALRDPTNPLSPLYEPQLAMMQAQRQIPQVKIQQHPLAPLPPEAAQQPGFIPGMGSMFAANQPHLATSPAHEPPPKPGDPYRPTLSKETRESLKALAEFQTKAQKVQEDDVDDTEVKAKAEKLEKDVKEGAPEKDFMTELKDLLDSPKEWNALNNPARRKEIEGRCKEMDIADIILHGEVRQEVPIRTGKQPLLIVYRSVSAEEDLAVKRMMFGETGGDRYLIDKFSIMQLTLGIVSINGEVLPSHLTEERKFDEKLFKNKYDKLLKFPIQFVADLGIQYQWFDERVRGLFVGSTEAVKNS